MAYQVIARKWRPRDFEELVGQEHVSQTLLNALRHNRLHHALLFTGPRGTGKTSSARILAKALRCPNAKDFIACHQCAECEEIASGRSLNVIEIDGASNNGVDAIRELRDTVGYMPSTGKVKLYIIDEVHMLSTSAFNALLKTLEEPPGHVIFVMATTEVNKIPETVLSRVQRFDFRCIPTRAIVAHLKNICDKENISAEPEALWTIARQGAGSMRDSQSFLDQAITFSSSHLTLANVTSVLGLTDRSLLNSSLATLVKQDPTAMAALIEKIHSGGFEPRLFIQDLLELLRNLLMVKLLGDKAEGVVDLPDSELAALRDLSGAMAAEDIHSLFDMALKGANDLGRAPDPQIALDMVLLRMTDATRLMALLSADGSKSVAPTAPPPVRVSVPTPSVAIQAPAAAPAPQLSTPGGGPQWYDLVKKIQGVNGVVGAQLENCFLHELSGQRIVLGVPPKLKFLADKLSAPDFKKKLLNYITTFWGPGFVIDVLVVEPKSDAAPTPKVKASQEKEEEALKIRKQVEDHPLVKSTQNIFKTEIRSIKENKP